MSYTLGQAAKATGKSKPTIQRAIQSGRMSAKRNDDGSYLIDPAELHRVFPLVRGDGNDTGETKQSEPPGNERMLSGQIEVLRELLRQVEGERDDLRRRLDDEASERRKAAEEIRRLTLLLTHQPEPSRKESATSPGRLFEKLFGRGKREG
jgi:excisionase family DNA binding protein